ncbi:hypothetical protein MUU72_12210 [Streptomyces sp. RS10V-4]|uniref:hypothetical protein n=1 Tax=Streptomyces rhizoryzae TaxID=2932493 RepID=UPI0020037BAD|nr:hypothetical protein [Streptomyces rhizoryzae]MCK7623853.1 hypothetical protein [Streptomyces rhizoryzae]
MVAAALPASLTSGTALAADRQATPAARPGEPMDDYAADPPMSADRFGELYPGRPGAPVRLPEFPGTASFRDLPDRFAGLSGTLPAFPHHPGGPFLDGPRHHHRHHPFGPRFPWSPASAPDAGTAVGDDASDGDPVVPAAPPRAPAADPVQLPAGRPARPVLRDSMPRTTAADDLDTAEPELPAPSQPRELAAPALPSPHRQVPSPVPEQDPGTPATKAGPGASAGPYSLETPGAHVERVLPMGAGMALTGLGLAFLGLRLRRR